MFSISVSCHPQRMQRWKSLEVEYKSNLFTFAILVTEIFYIGKSRTHKQQSLFRIQNSYFERIYTILLLYCMIQSSSLNLKWYNKYGGFSSYIHHGILLKIHLNIIILKSLLDYATAKENSYINVQWQWCQNYVKLIHISLKDKKEYQNLWMEEGVRVCVSDFWQQNYTCEWSDGNCAVSSAHNAHINMSHHNAVTNEIFVFDSFLNLPENYVVSSRHLK